MAAPLPPPRYVAAQPAFRLDAKTIGALVALVSALSGAIELRVKVGTMSDRLDRVERLVEQQVGAPKGPYASTP